MTFVNLPARNELCVDSGHGQFWNQIYLGPQNVFKFSHAISTENAKPLNFDSHNKH